MSRAQRLTFLAIALVIAVVAVVIIAASGNDEEEASPNRAQATPTATATPADDGTAEPTETPTPKPEPEVPLVQPGKITKLRFKQGDTVRFRVRSDVADEVHVHGYDLMKDVEPGKTTMFSFPASITGIFEIELENRGEQIAQLRVDPD